MANEILNMELSNEDENLLRESLTTWKESVYADLLEEVEELKAKKIEELEEANREYQTEVKEEFAQKMVTALDEMRTELRTEVISEMVSSNPELQILEKVKELIAPTLNEEYYGNVFAEEIQTLREQNDEMRREIELDEGASALAELIGPYSEKTQNIILAMIKEGNSEEVTEQFYELIESLGVVAEADDEEEEESDEEDEDDYDEEGEDIDDDDEDEDDEEDDEEGEDDEETDESVNDDDSYIQEGEEGSEETPAPKKINSFLSEMANLSRK